MRCDSADSASLLFDNGLNKADAETFRIHSVLLKVGCAHVAFKRPRDRPEFRRSPNIHTLLA